MADAEERFERYFEGLWKRRWWTLHGLLGMPDLVNIKTYSSGEITGGVVAVHGVSDDGTRVTYKLKPTDKRIPGYKRIAAPPITSKGSSRDEGK